MVDRRRASRPSILIPPTTQRGYVYKGCANYSLRQLADAEASALKASDIEKARKYKDQDERDRYSDPRVHILLAQIDDEKGETSKEVVELREFLEDSAESVGARHD